MSQIRYAIVAGAFALLLAPSTQAAQSGYPDRPIRLIIGSAPGSGPDIISRVISDRLYSMWNQRIVVDSRPGAAGTISAELALRAAPDGYTWMMLTSQLLVASEVFPNIKFDLQRDFASISLIGTVPFVLMVNPQVPARSIAELVALAKKSPGSLRYGSAGTGASEHLSGVMFTTLTGTQMLHVPYKGVAQAVADTIANEVQLTYAVVPAALPSIQGGRLRPLGVTSRKRAPLLPEVPSISEAVPGYEMLGWYSLVAQTGTPEEILARVSTDVVKIVHEPAFADRLKNLGIDVVGGTRADLDAFRRSQTERISKLVKAAGINNKQ
ncbi:MAG: tripartite tricarboxylate transporter substrate binding protein [Burkholderiales bacterium]|nr:tripartite tricarboxylate transporter substrate binding protein [Burkholderiales bacterium]